MKTNQRQERAVAEPDKSATIQYPMLDALRFLAAWAVMLCHLRGNAFLPHSEVACQVPIVNTAFFVITRLGSEAVVLFFVLSGFLVGGGSVARFRQGRFHVGRYFADRFTRIYTPLLPAIGFTVIVNMIMRNKVTFQTIIINTASLQGVLGWPLAMNGSLWSLAYEVWFYILCGSLLALFQASQRVTGVAFALLVVSGVVFSQLESAYLFAWLFGAGSFFLSRKRPVLLVVVAAPFLIAGLVGMQLTSISRQVDLEAFRWIGRPLTIVTLGAGCGLLIPAAASVTFRSRWMIPIASAAKWLASFSYTLYLIHTPLIHLLVYLGMIPKFDRLTFFTFGAFLAIGIGVGAAAWLGALLFEFQTYHVRRWIMVMFPSTSIAD